VAVGARKAEEELLRGKRVLSLKSAEQQTLNEGPFARVERALGAPGFRVNLSFYSKFVGECVAIVLRPAFVCASQLIHCAGCGK
jgi:hypothetical protein